MSTVVDIATAKRSIRWIPVDDRVPDDRRPVLAWGTSDWLYGRWGRKPAFLGITRYNTGADGSRGRFDCERLHRFSTVICRVTHWAEITGP
jgi:hypothetical protein